MQKRYDDTLTTRLETIYDAGCVHVLWGELYRWYEVKKIAAGTYRDIETRWQDLTKGKHGTLKCVEGGDGLYLFAENNIATLSAREGE